MVVPLTEVARAHGMKKTVCLIASLITCPFGNPTDAEVLSYDCGRWWRRNSSARRY